MKLSLKIIEALLPDLSLPIDQPDLEDKIGRQLGAIETIETLAERYSKAVIVNVVSVVDVVGSDHLHLCMVDDKGVVEVVDRNEQGLVQVVCGAANVHQGMQAVWLPPGSMVPSTANEPEPFILSARKLVGHVSNGMLASAKELAIGEDHQGIVDVSGQAEPGQSLSELLKLDDTVIDIENKMFTHRPDLFGELGIARELAGIYNRPFISPSWYDYDNRLTSDFATGLSVDNQLRSSACSRFMVVAINNVTIKPSPLWMQSYLSRLGVRPVNNLVDLTNYVMFITGQPLHAYDRIKLAPADTDVKFSIRRAESGEKLQLLNGSLVELADKDIVIASNSGPVGLGGVMGGANSEISQSTTQIVIECANFSLFDIRKSAMHHGVFSEAVTRYTKGQSALQCHVVLAYAWQLLKQLCPEAEIASNIVDDGGDQLVAPSTIRVPLDLINSYLGLSLPKDQIKSLLSNVELAVGLEENQILVTPPFWRTDILAPEDVIEEIARLYGYEQLPQSLPSRNTSPVNLSKEYEVKEVIRKALASAGANEILSYSFVHRSLLEIAGQSSDRAFGLSNAISPDLQYYRLSLSPSLLSKVHPNLKAGYNSFVLFELGLVHDRSYITDGLPQEFPRLALVVAADKKSAQQQGPFYYQARIYFDYLISALAIAADRIKLSTDLGPLADTALSTTVAIYAEGRRAMVLLDGQPLGLIGEYSSAVKQKLKLPDSTAGFELDLSLLKLHQASYQPLSKYPSISQDLTLPLKGDETYSVLLEEIEAKLNDILPKDVDATIKPIDCYQAADAPMNWTFRLTLRSYQRTLTDQEVTKLIGQLTD